MLLRTPLGFTLAELLIALLIIAEIATFTIPKVLSAQQNVAYNSKAKEVAGMLSSAYQIMKLKGEATGNTKPWDLTPYLNYVATDTSTVVDDWQGANTWGCSSTYRCLKLHNGGMLVFGADAWTFSANPGPQEKDNMILIQFDPDGKQTDGTTNGPGKAVAFTLYYDGGITTQGTGRPGTQYYGQPSHDPPWFSWN
jgi:prepilin-type N-terminal cleavage/methylation domain-containing protein